MLFTGSLITDCPIRQKIREFYRIDENIAVDHILPFAEVNVSARSRAWERARRMVLQIRQDQSGNGAIDALLNEYSLSSEEGVVLMCLAEALLRVPDKHTQDALIRDKISQGQWSSHLGSSDSLFVNASSWGLLVTGSMVNYADKRKQDSFGLLKKTIGRLGEPVIRKSMHYAMKIMGKQFVMGETIADATKRAATKEQKGYVYSYDMLGEGARTMADADRYLKSYQDAIQCIGQVALASGNNDPRRVPGISVKLSAIHPRYEFTHKSRVMAEIVPKLKVLCLQAKQYNIGLTVDAEESERLELSLDIIEAVFTDTDLGDWQGFGIALQAYQKRAIFVVEWLRDLTLRTNRRMMVRLVKGAYWDTEIKNAQKDGMTHFPVFTRKSSTDVSYHACANKLLEYRDTIYPQFATHNAYTAATIVELAGDDKEGFEFQCLHGMGDSLYDQIVAGDGIQCRIYAPVGHHEDFVDDLAENLNRTLASARNQLISIEKCLKKPKVLPGPTGESNILYLENRGVVICFADDNVSFNFWVISLVTALATGNSVVAVVSDLFYEEALAFRDKFISTGADKGVFQVAKLGHLETMLAHSALAGVVVDSHCDLKHYMSEKLAQRSGAILPVITSEYFDNLIQRLLTEKTISIDTTASGGNTSLMTLVEDEEI